jgi:hypothetical protein
MHYNTLKLITLKAEHSLTSEFIKITGHHDTLIHKLISAPSIEVFKINQTKSQRHELTTFSAVHSQSVSTKSVS